MLRYGLTGEAGKAGKRSEETRSLLKRFQPELTKTGTLIIIVNKQSLIIKGASKIANINSKTSINSKVTNIRKNMHMKTPKNPKINPNAQAEDLE